jgi:hypothetical protein
MVIDLYAGGMGFMNQMPLIFGAFLRASNQNGVARSR